MQLRRTLQQVFAWVPMVVLMRRALSYERGAPVQKYPTRDPTSPFSFGVGTKYGAQNGFSILKIRFCWKGCSHEIYLDRFRARTHFPRSAIPGWKNLTGRGRYRADLWVGGVPLPESEFPSCPHYSLLTYGRLRYTPDFCLWALMNQGPLTDRNFADLNFVLNFGRFLLERLR